MFQPSELGDSPSLLREVLAVSGCFLLRLELACSLDTLVSDPLRILALLRMGMGWESRHLTIQPQELD